MCCNITKVNTCCLQHGTPVSSTILKGTLWCMCNTSWLQPFESALCNLTSQADSKQIHLARLLVTIWVCPVTKSGNDWSSIHQKVPVVGQPVCAAWQWVITSEFHKALVAWPIQALVTAMHCLACQAAAIPQLFCSSFLTQIQLCLPTFPTQWERLLKPSDLKHPA